MDTSSKFSSEPTPINDMRKYGYQTVYHFKSADFASNFRHDHPLEIKKKLPFLISGVNKNLIQRAKAHLNTDQQELSLILIQLFDDIFKGVGKKLELFSTEGQLTLRFFEEDDAILVRSSSDIELSVCPIAKEVTGETYQE